MVKTEFHITALIIAHINQRIFNFENEFFHINSFAINISSFKNYFTIFIFYMNSLLRLFFSISKFNYDIKILYFIYGLFFTTSTLYISSVLLNSTKYPFCWVVYFLSSNCFWAIIKINPKAIGIWKFYSWITNIIFCLKILNDNFGSNSWKILNLNFPDDLGVNKIESAKCVNNYMAV